MNLRATRIYSAEVAFLAMGRILRDLHLPLHYCARFSSCFVFWRERAIRVHLPSFERISNLNLKGSSLIQPALRASTQMGIGVIRGSHLTGDKLW